MYKSLCKNIGKIFKIDQKNSFVKLIIRKSSYCLKKLVKIY